MNEQGLRSALERLGCTRVRGPNPHGELTATCPVARWKHAHGEDRSPSFSVRVMEGDVSLCRCFSCGHAGTFLYLVEMINRLMDGDFADLVKQVAAAENVSPADLAARGAAQVDAAREAARRTIDVEVWDESEVAAWVGQVPQYAIDRGLTIETCKAWGLGFDRKELRLVFPVRRADGRLVGVTGRAIDGDTRPKYKDYWGFKKSDYVYGEWMFDADAKRVFVVEGFLDVLLMWQRGFRSVVGTMGAMPSKRQAEKIRGFGVPVYLAQDNDDAGRVGRDRLRDALRGRVPLFDVPLPDGGDPDEMAEAEMRAAVDRAEYVL